MHHHWFDLRLQSDGRTGESVLKPPPNPPLPPHTHRKHVEQKHRSIDRIYAGSFVCMAMAEGSRWELMVKLTLSEFWRL